MGRYEYHATIRRRSPYTNGMCLLLLHPFQGFRCLLVLIGPNLDGIPHGRTRGRWKGMRPGRFRWFLILCGGGILLIVLVVHNFLER